MTEQSQVQPNQVQPNQTPEPATEQSQTTNKNGGVTQVAAPTTEQDGLPSDASERTKQRFAELTKQLSEEKQRAKSLEDAYKTLSQPAQSRAQDKTETVATEESFIDPVTGFLNEAALANSQKRAIEAEKNASEAKATIERFMQDQKKSALEAAQKAEATEAYTAHPDLNPDDKAFNKELHDFTTAIILQERYMNGNELTFKQAGDRAKAAINKIVVDAKGEGAQEALSQLDAKENAALETTGSPSRRQTAQDNLETLRQQSRHGQPDAIVERMKKIQGK